MRQRKSIRRSEREASRQDPSRKSSRRPQYWKSLTPAQENQRIKGFKLLRFRREGMTWRDAQKYSAITRKAAERLLPSAFFRDERGTLQVRGYDGYTRKLKIPTTKPGEFRLLRARGSRKASLVGTWNNAVTAAGRNDFSQIDAFPRNIFVDSVRLATSHYEVARIAAAVAESDKPYEDLYALSGAA